MAEVPIRVLIRFRPLSAVEKADEKGQRCRFVFDPSSTVVSVSSSSSSSSSTAQSIFSYANVHIDDDFFHSDLPASVADSKAFPFDHIFDPSCSQEDVWEQVQSLCGETLKGFNACFLAYGQTGSGKTWALWLTASINALLLLCAQWIHPFSLILSTCRHTMMGDLLNPEENGIIPRSLTSILTSEELAKATTEKGAEVQIRCSYLQIYNEQVYDLLDSSKVSLKIRESAQRGGTYVEGLTEEYIASLDDALLLLSIGSANRATASTKMNLNSSRSHTLFAITITQRFPNGSVLQGLSIPFFASCFSLQSFNPPIITRNILLILQVSWISWILQDLRKFWSLELKVCVSSFSLVVICCKSRPCDSCSWSRCLYFISTQGKPSKKPRKLTFHWHVLEKSYTHCQSQELASTSRTVTLSWLAFFKTA